MIDYVRYELKPSPTVKHQKLLIELCQRLYASCYPNGVLLTPPLDVYFDEGNLFQPDLIFITDENAKIIKEARIE
ncbi:hypothetical protein DNHGIG_02830 [Collibacillus ludicampi]|uniref:Restriction endonuclease domain-containing protein n=1 Tax=Collibacillus ludicampi TaxID=2771369 RepID=A0AAV4LAL0_9BACL|nr:hypothetical protein DNHGIG_02830 [Collibacillus ludicampi]